MASYQACLKALAIVIASVNASRGSSIPPNHASASVADKETVYIPFIPTQHETGPYVLPRYSVQYSKGHFTALRLLDCMPHIENPSRAVARNTWVVLRK
jgi:hypothetical protein